MLNSALVVDNNPVILKLLDHMLQQRGLQVHTAPNGLAALDLLDTYRPDIIFTDLIMPYIGGEKLCRIVSRREELAGTIMVVVSAIALEENVDFLAFGAHACIAKCPAPDMAANIDLILSLASSNRLDLLTGMRLGTENLVHRTVTRELLDSKHHLHLILENIDNGLIEFSREETILSCNAFARRLFGHEEIALIGRKLRYLFSAPDHGHVTECLEKFQTSGSPVECTRPAVVNGRDIVFKFLGMSWEAGQSSIMLLRDITEEKRNRDRLRQQRDRMEILVAERTRSYEIVNRELQEQIAERQKMNEELELAARQWSNTFDTISDFISVHDRDLKFVRVNKALAEFAGESPDKLIGRSCYEVMHGLKTPWPGCPHLKAIQSEKSITYEVNDANIGVPLLVTCTPLKGEDGTLLGSVHVARDISEQKKAADEREKLIRQLEESLAKVKLLRGFIPICASCKKIRDDRGYWQQVEEYIRDHSEAQFSHSICPTCAQKLYPELHDQGD